MSTCKTSVGYDNSIGTSLANYATIPDKTCFLATNFLTTSTNNRYVAS